ncbi:MAG TPA: hypothetical protein VFH56_11110 [Acidimicrobiales bacterium]|nr:hypothetical protein [Acidimicrobiales bacterium]
MNDELADAYRAAAYEAEMFPRRRGTHRPGHLDDPDPSDLAEMEAGR